jgi:hypothetical protein
MRIVLVHHEARDQDGDGDHRTEAEQGAEAQGGGRLKALLSSSPVRVMEMTRRQA